MSNRRTIWIVDDNAELLMNMSTMIMNKISGNFSFASVESASEITPNPGDIVILDQHGCDSDALLETALDFEVITISGDPDLNVDLRKPFSPAQLIQVVNERLQKLEAVA